MNGQVPVIYRTNREVLRMNYLSIEGVKELISNGEYVRVFTDCDYDTIEVCLDYGVSDFKYGRLGRLVFKPTRTASGLRSLIPAILFDDYIIKMFAYMSKESLDYTLRNNVCAFVSRSNEERNSTQYLGESIWVKGSTSGNTQNLIDVCTNYQKDCLLVYVEPENPACCKGPNGCFFRPMAWGGEN